jgi:hypothetical protein
VGEEVTYMKGRRHTPEQIVRKLREADRLLVEGSDVDAVCRQLEISVQTYSSRLRTRPRPCYGSGASTRGGGR